MTVLAAGLLEGLTDLTFSRGAARLAPARLGLALAKDFFGFDLTTVRFAAFPRADLEVLRALPLADFPLRAVARFFL